MEIPIYRCQRNIKNRRWLSTKEVFKRIEWFFNKEIASKYGAVTNEVNGLGISVMENLLFQ